MKYLFITAMAVLAACATHAAANYSVTIPMPADYNNIPAQIVDYDNGDTLATSYVENGKVVFTGEVKEPVMAGVMVAGKNVARFVLEEGKISLDSNMNSNDTELNRRFTLVSDSLAKIVSEFRALPRDNDSIFNVKGEALQQQYNVIVANAIKSNSDNPVGYYFFVQQVIEDPASVTEALQQYPAFANKTRIRKITETLKKMEATGVGHKFTDFTIPQPDGTKASLSDYVGKGKWMLVDFWASWCGPCMREIKVLKELLNEYGEDRLGIVGVAVWDEVADTQAAVNRMQIPWPQILDAKTVPTDLYGIMGIPCILLVDPQGNIVSRDLQDDALRSAVKEALNPVVATE